MAASQAEKYQEALNEVHWRRIRRGDKAFSIHKLGAIGTELAALSGFFYGTSWRKPVDELPEYEKGWVLSEAGFALRALGRLAEAAQPIQTSLDAMLAQKNWKQSAIVASNLSEHYLTLGDVKGALSYAQQSVDLADKSGDWGTQMVNRSSLANVLYQANQLAKARSVFHEAEEIQKKNQPVFPFLYSQRGILYCDLLLSQGNYVDVERRANQILEEGLKAGDPILNIALYTLSLGCTLAGQTSDFSSTGTMSETSEILKHLNQAMDGLRQANDQEMITRGLLVRAAYYRVAGDLDKARKDLDEAFTIASRGGVGLYLADCHLEYARLALADRGPGTED